MAITGMCLHITVQKNCLKYIKDNIYIKKFVKIYIFSPRKMKALVWLFGGWVQWHGASINDRKSRFPILLKNSEDTLVSKATVDNLVKVEVYLRLLGKIISRKLKIPKSDFLTIFPNNLPKLLKKITKCTWNWWKLTGSQNMGNVWWNFLPKIYTDVYCLLSPHPPLWPFLSLTICQNTPKK